LAGTRRLLWARYRKPSSITPTGAGGERGGPRRGVKVGPGIFPAGSSASEGGSISCPGVLVSDAYNLEGRRAHGGTVAKAATACRLLHRRSVTWLFGARLDRGTNLPPPGGPARGVRRPAELPESRLKENPRARRLVHGLVGHFRRQHRAAGWERRRLGAPLPWPVPPSRVLWAGSGGGRGR